jgi:RHS repeat-associated protein
VSENGSSWYTVFDSAVSGTYPETAEGRTYTFTARNVRYVRDYLNGSNKNAGNHWVEIEVWGTRTTVYVGAHYEKNVTADTTTSYYYAGGQRVAMRKAGVVYYLHADHLGSASVTTDASGAKVGELRYYPYGGTRYIGGVTRTDRRFNGQIEDAAIGLYFYNARYYDPALGRFVQADTIVPGAASSAGGGAATLGYSEQTRLTPLTVGFHETQFLSILNSENQELLQFGPAALWDGKVRREHNVPMGPANPQALNRYAYCLGNPLRYVDPTGHIGVTGGDDDIGYRYDTETGDVVLWNGLQQVTLNYNDLTDTEQKSLDLFMDFAEQRVDAKEDLILGTIGLGGGVVVIIGTTVAAVEATGAIAIPLFGQTIAIPAAALAWTLVAAEATAELVLLRSTAKAYNDMVTAREQSRGIFWELADTHGYHTRSY